MVKSLLAINSLCYIIRVQADKVRSLYVLLSGKAARTTHVNEGNQVLSVGTRTLSGGEVIIASKGGEGISPPVLTPWDAINRVPTFLAEPLL